MKNKMLYAFLMFALPAHGEPAKAGWSKKVRTIYMDDKNIVPIQVSMGGTVLSFPVKPTKVIMGRQKNFDIEYVETDVALAPLSSDARTNMFVYVLGRRYAFALSTGSGSGEDIILVRDKDEQLIRINTP